MYFRRIEDMRIDHDLTQQNIADFLECNREVYRRYEKGTREIPVWALIRLAEYYDCSVDYLLGGYGFQKTFRKIVTKRQSCDCPLLLLYHLHFFRFQYLTRE